MTGSLTPDDLYGLPLERFTAERNALAKRLRQEGQRDEASEVAELRKPSVTAWAVNQLVRTQKRDVEALFAAGDELVAVQAAVLGRRGDSGSLRQALEAEREAVDRLVERARGLLSAGGSELSAGRLEQARETLHAAALDEDARDQVRSGRLVRELRHVGLGSLGGGPAKRSAPDRKKQAGEARAARQEAARAQRRQRAQARLGDAEDGLATAREAYETASRERDRAERALDKATRAREKAKRALDDLG